MAVGGMEAEELSGLPERMAAPLDMPLGVLLSSALLLRIRGRPVFPAKQEPRTRKSRSNRGPSCGASPRGAPTSRRPQPLRPIRSGHGVRGAVFRRDKGSKIRSLEKLAKSQTIPRAGSLRDLRFFCRGGAVRCRGAARLPPCHVRHAVFACHEESIMDIIMY